MYNTVRSVAWSLRVIVRSETKDPFVDAGDRRVTLPNLADSLRDKTLRISGDGRVTLPVSMKGKYSDEGYFSCGKMGKWT